MVKLTADLIEESPQYTNPLREREIDLRGNKLSVIENLGATLVNYLFYAFIKEIDHSCMYVPDFLLVLKI